MRFSSSPAGQYQLLRTPRKLGAFFMQSTEQISEAIRFLLDQYEKALKRGDSPPEYPLGIFLLGFVTMVLVNTNVGDPASYGVKQPPHKIASMLTNLGLPNLNHVVEPTPPEMAFDEDENKNLFHAFGGSRIETLIAAAKTSPGGFSQETVARTEQVLHLLENVLGPEVTDRLLAAALPLTTFSVANDVMQYYATKAGEMKPMFKPGLDLSNEQIARQQAFGLLAKTVGHQRSNNEPFELRLATATSVYAVETNQGVVSTEEIVFQLRPLDEDSLTCLVWGITAETGKAAFQRLPENKQQLFLDHLAPQKGSHWNSETGYDINKLRGVNGGFKVDDPLIVALMAESINGVNSDDSKFAKNARKARLLAMGHTNSLPYLMALLIQRRWKLDLDQHDLEAIEAAPLEIPPELMGFLSGDWDQVTLGTQPINTMRWFGGVVMSALSSQPPVLN